jgi:hypothetical protein
MKLKKLILTAIALTVMNTASAYQITNGKVLEERVKITGSIVKGYLKDEPISRAVRTNGDSAIDARAYHAEGMTRTAIYTEGYHSAYIVNNSAGSKRYGYTIKLCADGDNCWETFRNILLDPQGRFIDSSSSHTLKYFDKPGTYKNVAETIIICDDKNYRRDSNNIDVRKP